MMKDADLKRNASGYYDETAYKAITAPPKAGEVWRYAMTGAYMLVLGGNEKVTSCLKLVKTPNDPDGMFPVNIGKEILYTDPIMIGYTFNDKLDCYVTKLHPEQLKDVQKEVGKYLGITATASVPNDLPMEERVEKLTIERDEAYAALNGLHDSYVEATREMTRLNIYKEMYMDLIDKLVAVKVGAVDD